MKKLLAILLVAVLALSLVGCKKDDSKVIKVCASDVPHAEVLEGVVKAELKKLGYTLEVTILDWQIQNESVAKGDYDANYFQHVPYLESDSSAAGLFAVVKVHYEPLGIYRGKSTGELASAKSIEICNDSSNAIRAFELLTAKGVISKETEGDNYPVKETADGKALNFNGDSWTASTGLVVTLVAENFLVASLADYDFACLPCNTAYTGNVTSATRVAVEDDPAQVQAKANILAARSEDYKNDEAYKAKIDALAEVLLGQAVSDFFATKYLGAMTCDASTQIDLRTK